jgi:hypothetical protein
MSTRVEDFIKNNKSSFDTAMPGDDLWSKMELELNKKAHRRPNRKLWLSIAASFIAVLSIAYIYSQEKGPENTLAEVNPTNAKKQVRFASMIEKKTDSLQVYADENPELYQKFSSDLAKIQVDYDALKQDLAKSPNQEFIVRAMEKNLELQLQVVSQQLQIINKVRQVENNQL